MEGGKEQNFWPGFVDALSNVVLVMIFVVVVFVVTLFYYSQKLAQFKAIKFLEKKEQQEQSATPSKDKPDVSRLDDGKNPDAARMKLDSQQQSMEIAALKGQVAALQAKLSDKTSTTLAGSLRSDEGAPTKVIQIEKAQKSAAPEVLAGVKIDNQADAIALHFDSDGVELTPEAVKALNTNLARWTDRIKTQPGKLVITGVVGTLSYTEGRRRAYYRTIAVRNYLIDLGIAPNRVASRVVPGNESAESNATVIIQYAAGK